MQGSLLEDERLKLAWSLEASAMEVFFQGNFGWFWEVEEGE